MLPVSQLRGPSPMSDRVGPELVARVSHVAHLRLQLLEEVAEGAAFDGVPGLGPGEGSLAQLLRGFVAFYTQEQSYLFKQRKKLQTTEKSRG